MSLFYVTGTAGSGKSEVLKALRARGYEAYGVDEDGLAHWHNNKTGYVHPKSSVKAVHRTPGFIQDHDWKISRMAIEELATKAKHKTIFLCGVAANENELLDLFDKVFFLAVDESTLRNRLFARTDNDFGKSPHELAQIVNWHRTVHETYIQRGDIVIDATPPIDKVVDAILEKANL